MSWFIQKTIKELFNLNFFIPSYQRGYRWTERHIENLLEDINSFVPRIMDKSGRKTLYCLQPIVLKTFDKETIKKNDLEGTWYEVIDGQQRLTSIFLIVHYANQMWNGNRKTPFQLRYETRNDSSQFLNGQIIDKPSEDVVINHKNIDYYHITKAYSKIHNWVICKTLRGVHVELHSMVSQSRFRFV